MTIERVRETLTALTLSGGKSNVDIITKSKSRAEKKRKEKEMRDVWYPTFFLKTRECVIKKKKQFGPLIVDRGCGWGGEIRLRTKELFDIVQTASPPPSSSPKQKILHRKKVKTRERKRKTKGAR